MTILTQARIDEVNTVFTAAIRDGAELAEGSEINDWRQIGVFTPTRREAKNLNIRVVGLNGVFKKFGAGHPLQTTRPIVRETTVGHERQALGIDVDRDELAEDTWGHWTAAMGELGSLHPESHYYDFWERIAVSGFSGTYDGAPFVTFDGEPLFSASHKYVDRDTGKDTGTYSNTTTAALSETSYDDALTAIRQYRTTAGRLPSSRVSMRGIQSGIHLRVGIGAEAVARSVFLPALKNGGDSNIARPPESVEVVRALDGDLANFWFLFLVGGRADHRAMYFRETQEMRIHRMIDETLAVTKFGNQFTWAVDAKFGFAPGFPTACYGANVAP